MTADWKPIDKDRPDEGISVIVANRFWDNPVQPGFLDSGRWFVDDHTCQLFVPQPTHWDDWPEAPLPVPPEQPDTEP